MNSNPESDLELYKRDLAKLKCEEDHLWFTRYFFKIRQAIKFRVNWHHVYLSDIVDRIIRGELKNVAITISPGSSKTELLVVNLIARGLAINPRARFLHLSGSDSLASLNSSIARDIITSDEYQALWPLKIADDSKSKKRWNVVVDGQQAGGVYATSLGGQVTGFRAGHMADGFQGAIIIDDPVKPEDAYSKSKLEAANRKLLTTVKSRRANPETPIVIIMQRVAEMDPIGFIKAGNLGDDCTFIKVPAVIDDKYISMLPDKYAAMVDRSHRSVDGRFSYWPYKEPIDQLLSMERGDGSDQSGAKISRHVFTSQYQQEPTALGGNIIKGEYFNRYMTAVLPKIKYRKVYADTAQKTKEYNDFSVFEEWGMCEDGKIYLIDMIRGKWEAPELQKRAIAFWQKCLNRDKAKFGDVREMKVEDKSSGTGLVQTLKLTPHNIPVKPIERVKDKLTRVMDGLPYIESRQVCIPEDAPFTNDFVAECESFAADMSHEHDDQVDPMLDAIEDLLSSGNKIKMWEQLAEDRGRT